MIFQEINRIGQTFIVDPFKYTPIDLCPREEVIAPEKIARLIGTAASDWENYRVEGWGGLSYLLQRCWVPWTTEFTERVSGVCYYALAEDPELFWSLSEVQPECPQSIYEWLSANIGSYFAVTTPLLMYHGDTSDIIYTVNCGVGTVARPMNYGNTLNQMLDANGFALGNGLTLALAMQRSGRWRSSAVLQALHRCCEEDAGGGAGLGLGSLSTTVPTAFISLYVQNSLPHIANYPALYASCGPAPCGLSLRRFLADIDGLVSDPLPYLQHVSTDLALCQVTSPAAAAMPHLRMSAGSSAIAQRTIGTAAYALFNPTPYYTEDLAALRAHTFLDNLGAADGADGADADAAGAPPPHNDFYVMDIAGLIMSVVSQNSSWAWWNSGSNAADVIHRFAAAGFATTTDAMDYVVRRLFALHEENYARRRGRLCAMLKTWIATLDPAGDVFFSWFVKYVFGRDLRIKMHRRIFSAATPFGHPHSVSWNPPVPLTFMRDMLAMFGDRFPLYNERVVSLMTNHNDLICDIYGANGAAPGPVGGGAASRSGDLLDMTELGETTRKRYRFRINVCLYRSLKRYAADEPEARFLREIDARVVSRLVGLKREIAAASPAHAIVADLVTDYWRRHRIELALPFARPAMETRSHAGAQVSPAGAQVT